MKNKFGNYFLDLLFPKHCFGCQKEKGYLCIDCKATLEVSGFHRKEKTKYLEDIYFATTYENLLIKTLIKSFKYQPFARELSLPLASLIKDHIKMLDFKPQFLKAKEDYYLIPIPLSNKRLRWRGFNQAEEIAKHFSDFFEIPLRKDILEKNKEIPLQVSLPEKERKTNISNVFSCTKGLNGKGVLLVDDVYTTGSTMNEAARTLRQTGAREVIGITITLANPDQDFI